MYNCFVAEKKPSFYAKKLLILPTQEVDCFWSLDNNEDELLQSPYQEHIQKSFYQCYFQILRSAGCPGNPCYGVQACIVKVHPQYLPLFKFWSSKIALLSYDTTTIIISSYHFFCYGSKGPCLLLLVVLILYAYQAQFSQLHNCFFKIIYICRYNITYIFSNYSLFVQISTFATCHCQSDI